MSYPLTKDDYPKCQKLLENVGMDPNCEPFLTPVEWERKYYSISFSHTSLVLLELGLLDYPKIVQRPMDFDTLKKHLLDAKFATIEDFLADF